MTCTIEYIRNTTSAEQPSLVPDCSLQNAVTDRLQ